MKIKIILGVLVFVLTNNAHSTIIDLVERDYLTAGDGLITYDKSTGLEWLDVNFTQGLSILEVEAIASIWADGWQWTTVEQMETMFDHAKDDELWSGQGYYSQPVVVYPIVELLGPTRSYNSAEYVNNHIYGISRNFETFPLSQVTGLDFAFLEGGIMYDVNDPHYPGLPYPPCGDVNCVDWGSNEVGEPSWLETDKSEYYGSFLVRAVPVPAAVWLFCSGLLGLIGVARRKKS